MSTVGLSMIVKDEAHCVERALASAEPLINYALIEDTGSTDGTQDVIRRWLDREAMPGAVIEQPWRGFAYNRSHALEALRQHSEIDYALYLDADDLLVLTADPDQIRSSLGKHDVYRIPVRHGSITHRRPQILSNRKPFRFRGVVHEFLDCAEPHSSTNLDSVSVQVIGGGARNQAKEETYRRDAEAITRALEENAEPDLAPRYTFYLAQSWRDCGEPERALEQYLRRAEMPGGWPEEAYVALLTAARLMEQLQRPLGAVLAAYQRAAGINPRRAEAWHGAARACRLAGCFRDGYALACRGVGLPVPEGLFIEPATYLWALLDELSLCAYYSGRFAECRMAADLALRAELDPENRQRIGRTAAFAQAKIG